MSAMARRTGSNTANTTNKHPISKLASSCMRPESIKRTKNTTAHGRSHRNRTLTRTRMRVPSKFTIVLDRPWPVLVAVALFPSPVPVVVAGLLLCWTRQAQVVHIFRIQRDTQPHVRRRVSFCCRSRPRRHARSWALVVSAELAVAKECHSLSRPTTPKRTYHCQHR